MMCIIFTYILSAVSLDIFNGTVDKSINTNRRSKAPNISMAARYMQGKDGPVTLMNAS